MTEFPLSRRSLALAGLVVAVCVAGYATLQNKASPPLPVQQVGARFDIATADAVFTEDFDWWIQNVGSATALFQCWPTAARNLQASVVVWTDRANKIVAFGAAQEGAQLPLYTAVLGKTATMDANDSVHVAKEGHVLLTAGKKSVLQLTDATLDCERNWDD